LHIAPAWAVGADDVAIVFGHVVLHLRVSGLPFAWLGAMQRDELGVQVVDAVALEDDGGACYPEVGVELARHAAREAHQAENHLIVLFVHAAAQVAFGDDDRVARSRGEDGEKGQEVLIFGHDMALTVACNDLTKHAVTHGSSLVV